MASRRLATNGLEAYREAKKRDIEGLIAKDNSSLLLRRPLDKSG